MFFIPGLGGMPGGKGDGGKGFPMGMGIGFDDDDEEDDDDAPGEVDNSKFYEALGISRDATDQEIRKAYRAMAMKHHPDKGGDPEVFKDIQEAHEVLSDPEKRQRYDRYGEDGLNDDGPSPEALFSQLFGGKGMGKGMGKGRGQRPRTDDQMRPMWVTLEQIYCGVTRPLPVTRKVIDPDAPTCEACNGQGFVMRVIRMGPMVKQETGPCPKCGKTVREVLDVFVEKGSPDGHKIVFHGKADECPGHEPGNFVVVVKQQEHPRFMRKGADLYMERDITLAEALTGFRLVIPHLDGRKLVVTSKPGEVLQPQHGGPALKAVRGGGMPIHQDPFNFGNLFLVLSIRFPLTIEPSAAAELRRLLGAPDDSGGTEAETVGEGDEEAEAEDIDPLETSKQNVKAGSGEAYDEDAEQGMGPGVQCQQQ